MEHVPPLQSHQGGLLLQDIWEDHRKTTNWWWRNMYKQENSCFLYQLARKLGQGLDTDARVRMPGHGCQDVSARTWPRRHYRTLRTATRTGCYSRESSENIANIFANSFCFWIKSSNGFQSLKNEVLKSKMALFFESIGFFNFFLNGIFVKNKFILPPQEKFCKNIICLHFTFLNDDFLCCLIIKIK